MKSKGLKRSDIPEHIPPRFWSRVDVRSKTECWPWRATKRGHFGYGQIGIKNRYPMAHIVAFVLTKGDVDPGMCVLHRCDNPPCCNPDHLWLGTYLDNNRDRDAKGRSASHKGILNGRSILKERDVIDIRAAHLLGSDYESLAAKYGVAVVTIAKTCQRRLWKHVE